MIEIQGDAGAVWGVCRSGKGAGWLRWVISAYRQSVRCARPGDGLWPGSGGEGAGSGEENGCWWVRVGDGVGV